jgi:PAS domain S-box-containing protein
LDYRTAFEQAPIGLVLSRQRLMIDCNVQALAIFGATREQMVGQSFECLYPTADEFERTGQRIVASLDGHGFYADDRVMKRLGGRRAGELFWCHVSGRTAREREIAALLIDGLTSKLIGKRLGVSPRTVDVYRARLMRKMGAASTAELVNKLLSG